MYKLTKYLEGIYLVQFDESYDLAMTFLRYQEYYECPNEKIRGNQFTILDYIDWYVKDFSDGFAFSYHLDWAGFNMPATIINEVWELGILDPNHNDARMLEIYEKAKEMHGNENFYLIGVNIEDDGTLEHEVAHALYFINPEYNIEVNALCNTFSKETQALICEYLTETGYPEKVHIDETQAYLSNGSLQLNDEISKKSIEFTKLFEKYNIKDL